MFPSEQEMTGIDVAVLDEALGFLGATAGVFLVHQATLIVHEAVKVAACSGQALTEIIGRHLQDLASRRVARPQNLTEREDQSLLAIQTKKAKRLHIGRAFTCLQRAATGFPDWCHPTV
jgi:hypothetical protein